MVDAAETETEAVETPTTITLPEPDAPANDNAGEAAPEAPDANAAPGPTRAEKRVDRARNYRDVQRDAAEARQQLAQERQERQRLSEQVAVLRERTEAIQYRQRQEAGDPYDKQISELETKADRHLAAAAQAKDAETAKAEMREYHKANRLAATVEARREMAAEFQRYDRSRPDPEQAGMKVTLSSEFPWLVNNANARGAADGYIGVLVAKGRPNNLATFREACAMAAKDFGLGGTAERPSEGRRAAYSGISGREGAGEGGGERSQLQMSGDDAGKLRKMAVQMFPSDEPDVAWNKWLKGPGARLARK